MSHTKTINLTFKWISKSIHHDIATTHIWLSLETVHMNSVKCSWYAGNLKRLVRQKFAFVFPKNNGVWTRFAALYRATSGHDLCGKVQQQNHQLHTDGADRQRWISVCADRNPAVFEPLWDLSLETNRSWQTDTVADAFQGLSHPLWLLPLSSLSTPLSDAELYYLSVHHDFLDIDSSGASQFLLPLSCSLSHM